MTQPTIGLLLADRYRLIRVLGSGGFGQTYVAEDTHQPHQPLCVVKQLRPASQEVSFLRLARRLFQTEVDALRTLGQHPNIPRLIDSFEDGAEFYLVQELIEGEPFSQEIKHHTRLSEAEVVAFLQDVLTTLAFVHQHQVVHRDIKPANLIRRSSDSSFALIDFGAVKEIRNQTLTQNQTSITIGIGTQGYTPSEQLAGKPRYSSDLYALGMTAIHALTGRSPADLPEHPHTGEILWQNCVDLSPGLIIFLTKLVHPYYQQRYPSTTEALADLARLEDLPLYESAQPEIGMTYLPTTLSPKANLRRMVRSVAIASVAVTSVILGIRQLGGFNSLELVAYDRLVQLHNQQEADPRILVVEVTENDLRSLNRPTPSDQTVADAIANLQQFQPRVIGMDLHRDLPQEPGHEALMAQLQKADNVIAITKIGDTPEETIPPPHGLPPEQYGFNDFPVDDDGVVRRNLLFAPEQSKANNPNSQVLTSFALQVVLHYLADEGISPRPSPSNSADMQLKDTVFHPIESNFGGYTGMDSRGYQIMLDYRAPYTVAERVTLAEVLANKVTADQVHDKIVLIGLTAASSKDLFYTPYSLGARTQHRMSGVVLHAQMASQILTAVLDQRPPTRSWPETIEVIWVLGCAIAGGFLGWQLRHPLRLTLGGSLLLGSIIATSVGCFWIQIWVPVATPVLGAIATLTATMLYRTYISETPELTIAADQSETIPFNHTSL